MDVFPTRWLRTADVFIGGVLTIVALVATIGYEIIHLSGWSFGQATYAVDNYDEGVYIATGSLMAHGYHLYSQIYSAQPPLLPSVLGIAQKLAGSGEAQSRVTILVFGVIALLATMAVANLARAWIAGGLAAIFLVLSPEFLVYSHAVEEEIPVMALGTISLALAIRWWKRPGATPAGLSGFFFGLAVMTKFFAFALLGPLVVIMTITLWDGTRPQERESGRLKVAMETIGRHMVGFLVCAAAPIAISFAVWGGAEWQQMVTDRISASSGQAAFQSASNLHLLRDFVSTDPGLAILAVVGGIFLLVREPRMGLILDSWGLATLAILLDYHPLFGHHLIILLAPAAALGGAGLSCLGDAWIPRFKVPGSRTGAPGLKTVSLPGKQGVRPAAARLAMGSGLRVFLAGAMCVAVLAYLALLPRLGSAYPGLLVSPTPHDRRLASAGAGIRKLTPLGSFVATGNPWICVYASRLCVPNLVDTSYVRIESGKLSAAGAVLDTEQYAPAAIVLARGLCTFQAAGRVYMAPYVRWVRSGGRFSFAFTPLALDGRQVCPTGIYLAHWPLALG